ncbi:MAG: hypothetical protein ACLFPR_14065, partial [Desulfococcaceae bacterium]
MPNEPAAAGGGGTVDDSLATERSFFHLCAKNAPVFIERALDRICGNDSTRTSPILSNIFLATFHEMNRFQKGRNSPGNLPQPEAVEAVVDPVQQHGDPGP